MGLALKPSCISSGPSARTCSLMKNCGMPGIILRAEDRTVQATGDLSELAFSHKRKTNTTLEQCCSWRCSKQSPGSPTPLPRVKGKAPQPMHTSSWTTCDPARARTPEHGGIQSSPWISLSCSPHQHAEGEQNRVSPEQGGERCPPFPAPA